MKLPVLSSLGQLAGEMTFPDFSALRKPGHLRRGVHHCHCGLARNPAQRGSRGQPRPPEAPHAAQPRAAGPGRGQPGERPARRPAPHGRYRALVGQHRGRRAEQAVGFHSRAAAAHEPAVSGRGAEFDSAGGAGGGAAAGGLQADHAGPLPQAVARWAGPSSRPFIITIVAVLFTDLLKGVSIGLVLGFFFILKDNAKAGSYLRRDEAADIAEGDESGLLHLRLPEHVSFLNKASIVTTLEQLPAGSRVILDGTRSHVIDHDVLEAIEAFRQAAPARGIELELRGIRQVAVGAH